MTERTATRHCRRLIVDILNSHPRGLRAGELRARVWSRGGPVGAIPSALQALKIDGVVVYHISERRWRRPIGSAS